MRKLVVGLVICFFCVGGIALVNTAGVLPRLSFGLSQKSLRLSWSGTGTNAIVEWTDNLGPKGQWTPLNASISQAGSESSVALNPSDPRRFYRLRMSQLTRVASTSPVDGEGDVSVNREVIVRFSAPLAATVSLTSSNLFAEYAGRQLLSRVELSSDRLTATLFFQEPIPGSTRINVTFGGTGVTDANGQLIDADGDGVAGGSKSFSFQTLSTTPVGNTAVIGTVFASEMTTAPGGGPKNVPLAGVTITVDGQEESMRAVTDANGNFVLQPAPAGSFFVKIDGRTVPGTQYPYGSYYPFVGKEWEAIPGRTNNLAGGTGQIFLPLIPSGTLKPISPTAPTVVGFAPSVIKSNAAFAGVSITVPPNDLFSDNGVRGGMVGIAPVPPDRLPGPLPLGLQFPLVITIQTDGPENFDVPVPVRFPNLPDPVTGQKLGPGAKTALWSFNHRTGRWEIQGPATVSADGQYVDTDPGVGVRQPGWHGVNPATSGYCDGFGPCVGNGPNPGPGPGGPPGPKDPCQLERKKEWSASLQCAATGLLAIPETIPIVGCAISVGQAIVGSVIDCNIDSSSCKSSVASQFLGAALGCLPFGGGLAGLGKCMIDTASAHGEWVNCMRANGLSPTSLSGGAGGQMRTATDPSQIAHNVYSEQAALMEASAALLNACFGSSKWTECDPQDLGLWTAFIQALANATLASSDGGTHITPAESATLLAMPLPANITAADAAAVVARMDGMANGTLPDAQFDRAGISSAAADLAAVAQELENRGWQTTYDGFVRGLSDLTHQESQIANQGAGVTGRLYYQITDVNTDFVQRGRLNTKGQFDTVVFAPGHYYLVQYVDPVSLWVGRTFFLAGATGTQTVIPLTNLAPPNPQDSDSDGLPDEVELILGTNPNKADTNGDGISDGAALQQGLNPLDGIPAHTGVIAAAATSSDTWDISIRGDLAAVAGGDKGFYLYNIKELLNPTLVGQVPAGGGTKKVALVGQTLCIADDYSGVLLYDVSNPAKPVQAQKVNLSGTVNAMQVLGDRICIAINNTLYIIDSATGAIVDQHQYNAGTIHDMAVAGDHLYTIALQPNTNQPHTVSRIDLGTTLGDPSSTNAVNGHPTFGKLHIFAGSDGVVYVGAVDDNNINEVPGMELLQDSSAGLQVVGAPSPIVAFDVVANGSGLAIFTGVDAGLEQTAKIGVLDVSHPTVTSNLLARFEVAGAARAIALHNGLIYAATSQGLQVVSYLAFDQKGIPPTLKLDANFSLTALQAEAGTLGRLTALATDDVQVRNVEIYVDGNLAESVDHYPFDFHFPVPAYAVPSPTFTLRAKAIDTGGNFTWSDPLTLTVVDTTPPFLTSVQPISNAVLQSGLVGTLSATVNESLNPRTVMPTALELTSAGPDKTFGTADDVVSGASGATYDPAEKKVVFQLAAPLSKGLYHATIQGSLADLAGNVVVPYTWNFEVRDPDTWTVSGDGLWNVPANWTGASLPTNSDVVIIDRPGTTVTYGGLTTLLTKLLCTGSFSMSDGNLTLNDDSTVGGDFTLAGGTLSVQKSLDVKGQFKFTGGSFMGGGTVLSQGGLQLHSSNGVLLVGPGTLENAGAGTWFANSGVEIQDKAATILNDAGATMEAQDGSVMFFASGYAGTYPQFINNGTFLRTGATNTTTAFNSVQFNNNGIADVQAGKLSLAGGGVGAGQFKVEPGATLDFNAATNTLMPGSSITGAGQVTFSGGSVVLNGPYDVTGSTTFGQDSGGYSFIQIPTTFNGPVHIAGSLNIASAAQAILNGGPINIECPVNINGGSLAVNSTNGPLTVSSITSVNGRITGSTDIIVTGPVHLQSGTALAGPGRLIPQGGIQMDGTIQLSGSLVPGGTGRIIDNSSNCVLTAGATVGVGTSNTFNNLVTGLFDMQGDDTFGGGGLNSAVFNNAGTFRKSAGTGKGQLSPLFLNTGTVDVQSGSLAFFNGFIQSAGQTLLHGGTLTGYPYLDFEGGVFVGTGTFDIPYLTNGCQFSMGQNIGQLKATVYYTQTTNGVLNLKIGGTNPATGYDQFVILNQATLAGTLNLTLVNGYIPKIGDTFQVLTCSSRTGTFNTVNGLAIGGGLKLVVSYTNTGVTVSVAASP